MGAKIEELPGVVQDAVKLYLPHVDDPTAVQDVLARYHKALIESDGDAAIEIGVRDGGTSAAFNYIANQMPSVKPHFSVFSVDPYGEIPYKVSDDEKDIPVYSGGRLLYGNDHYVNAKKNLAEYPHSYLYPVPAQFFLSAILPGLKWSVKGESLPRFKRFMSFCYIDGQHANRDVMLEYLTLYEYTARNGVLMFDDIQYIDEAVKYIKETALKMRVKVEEYPPYRIAVVRKD